MKSGSSFKWKTLLGKTLFLKIGNRILETQDYAVTNGGTVLVPMAEKGNYDMAREYTEATYGKDWATNPKDLS